MQTFTSQCGFKKKPLQEFTPGQNNFSKGSRQLYKLQRNQLQENSAGNIIFEEHFDRYHQTDTYFEQRHNREELEIALAQNLIPLSFVTKHFWTPASDSRKIRLLVQIILVTQS